MDQRQRPDDWRHARGDKEHVRPFGREANGGKERGDQIHLKGTRSHNSLSDVPRWPNVDNGWSEVL